MVETGSFDTPSFSIKIPSDWKEETDEGTYGFYKSKEMGAINISTYKRPEGRERMGPKKFLEGALGWLGDFIHKIKIDSYTQQHSKWARSEFIFAGTFWRIMVAMNKQRVAYITYNCAEKNRKVEINEVNDILDSFKLNELHGEPKVYAPRQATLELNKHN